MYEVEQKFPVDQLTSIEAALAKLEVPISEERIEVDLYFNHPGRDFAQTDEALRIRQVEDRCRITYKGPKIDPTTKTRREIDLELPSGSKTFSEWNLLLDALGFRPAGEVRKIRRKAWVDWEGEKIEVSLDRVDPLGSFVELELIVADENDLEPAKARLASLAKHLNLKQSERRSYLGLLLGGD